MTNNKIAENVKVVTSCIVQPVTCKYQLTTNL
jgi:hypothetical protein